MRTYRFPLEAVRTVRRREEELAEQAYAAAVGTFAGAERALAGSRADERRLHEQLRDGSLGAAELLRVSRFATMHRQVIVDRHVAVGHAQRGVDHARAVLAGASARRRALDTLDDRRRAEHRAAWLAEEARELDELATVRHTRAAAAAAEVAA